MFILDAPGLEFNVTSIKAQLPSILPVTSERPEVNYFTFLSQGHDEVVVQALPIPLGRAGSIMTAVWGLTLSLWR